MRPPAEDPRLREDLALLADCALPPELRVSTQGPGTGPGGQVTYLGTAVVGKPHIGVQFLMWP